MAEIIDGFDLWNGFGAGDGGLLSIYSWISTTTGRAFVAGRFGGQALRISDATGANGSARRPTTGGTWGPDFSHHFAYMNLNLAANNPFFYLLDSAAAVQLALNQHPDGSVSILRGSTIVATSAAGLLTANQWASIEFFGDIDNAGTADLWINDSLAATYSGDTQQTANANCGYVQFSCPDASGGSNYAYFDDYWGRDVSSRPGLQRVEVAAANGDTADKDFVASTGVNNYACIDEIPVSTSDYVSGSTVGDVDLYSLATLSSNPASIASAQVVGVVGKTDAGSRSLALLADDGTQQQGPDIALPTPALSTVIMPLPTMPDGSPLSYAGLSALKIGQKVTV